MDPNESNINHDKRSKMKRGGEPSDAPKFRSMMIDSPAGEPGLLGSSTNPDAPPLIKGEPALYQKPTGKSQESTRTVASSSDEVAVIPPSSPFTTGPGWENPRLTRLGLYYPLGPCKTTLLQSDIDQVLENLVGIFRAQSLHTQYNDSPISAVCRSLDQVELEVVLFASREDPDKMIMEVSRRDGDCVSYHMYAHQIVLAVSGVCSDPEPVIPSSWNLSVLNQADSIGQATTENETESMEIASGLVSTDRYDARRLGLESVMHMTDPNKSGWSTSKAVVEGLMCPRDVVEERLSHAILGYACQDVAEAAADEPSFGGATEADFAYLGLIIVSHILQVAAGAQTMDVEAFLDICPPDFLDIILQKANCAQQNPHQAYYAVQCLAALCHCVPSTKLRIKGADVEEAQLVGESCHQALATVTQKLLINLQA